MGRRARRTSREFASEGKIKRIFICRVSIKRSFALKQNIRIELIGLMTNRPSNHYLNMLYFDFEICDMSKHKNTTLEGSFSDISKLIFATKLSFCSIKCFQVLHDSEGGPLAAAPEGPPSDR